MSAHAFKAATWNVYHSTPRDELSPILDGLLEDNVSIFLVQEASSRFMRDLFRDAGLGWYLHGPQYAVAWNRDLWVPVAKEGLELSETRFFRKGGKTPIPTEAASVILSDRVGRTLEALSYHTPAGVQRGGPARESVPNRVKALEEAMGTLGARAAKAQTRAILYGGDDNVDERRGPGWGFMLKAATGLRQVQAPKGTHGRVGHPDGRRIDDFRTKGLKVGRGSVRRGGGDHGVHVRTFRWA